MKGFFDPLRKSAASVREMLIGGRCGSVGRRSGNTSGPQRRGLRSGIKADREVRNAARGRGKITPPAEPKLKDPKDFRYIGKSIKRLDSPEKVDGTGIFGIDVKVPGMLTATILRSPVIGGKVSSVRRHSGKGRQRRAQCRAFGKRRRSRRGQLLGGEEGPRRAEGHVGRRRDEGRFERGALPGGCRAAKSGKGIEAKKIGDVAAGRPRAAKTVEAVYYAPYLAHATMEPMNATADVRADSCEVWSGIQAQMVVQGQVAKELGIAAGKGQGQQHTARRRIRTAARRLRHGRGSSFENCRETGEGRLDTRGRHAWRLLPAVGLQRDVGRHRCCRETGILAAPDRQSVDHGNARPAYIRVRTAAGPARRFGHRGSTHAPVRHAEFVRRLGSDLNQGVPVGFWRSVGSSHTAFSTECFLDELAHAAGKDPLAFRLSLLEKHPRHAGVLKLAAEKAGWGKPLAKGMGRGIAVHESFGSYVAQVAEVSVGKDGKVQVHRVVCAVDCGQVVNPDTVDAQMEGGIVYGLTAALYGEITLKDGRVEQRNFYDYKMLRMNEMPKVEVYIVPSTEKHGGVGEPGTPPIAPAVVNAIFAATGKRIRSLPIRPEELKSA